MYNIGNIPIVNALKNYIDNKTIRFHMPGHKGSSIVHQSIGDLLGNKIFLADVTNVPGMDDLHRPHGVIDSAQRLAARAFGANYTYFLVNGSSCGLQALVLTVCNAGDKILVPRNIHRSILSGVILSGAVPVFYMPEYDDDYGIPLGINPDTIRDSLDKHDVKAILLVSPTYHGITSDISSIAKIAHERRLPLIVDEAHGPHLQFHSRLPDGSLQCGADASVHGSHKLLTALTQASMLHLKSSLIDRHRLEANLKLLQSTSTSYLLLSSLDAARALMEDQGEYLLENTLNLANYTRQQINETKNYRSFGAEVAGKPGIHDLDLTKITISVKPLRVTGFWVEQFIRQNHHIQVEMSDLFNILLLLTHGNTRQDIDIFINALQNVVNHVSQQPPIDSSDLTKINIMPDIPDLVATPRDAYFSPTVNIPLEESVGRISGEVVACCPPGIPIICPGERITSAILDYLIAMRNIGALFQGTYDPNLTNIAVIA